MLHWSPKLGSPGAGWHVLHVLLWDTQEGLSWAGQDFGDTVHARTLVVVVVPAHTTVREWVGHCVEVISN